MAHFWFLLTVWDTDILCMFSLSYFLACKHQDSAECVPASLYVYLSMLSSAIRNCYGVGKCALTVHPKGHVPSALLAGLALCWVHWVGTSLEPPCCPTSAHRLHILTRASSHSPGLLVLDWWVVAGPQKTWLQCNPERPGQACWASHPHLLSGHKPLPEVSAPPAGACRACHGAPGLAPGRGLVVSSD